MYHKLPWSGSSRTAVRDKDQKNCWASLSDTRPIAFSVWLFLKVYFRNHRDGSSARTILHASLSFETFNVCFRKVDKNHHWLCYYYPQWQLPSQCLKITQEVSFYNISSGASYVYSQSRFFNAFRAKNQSTIESVAN